MQTIVRWRLALWNLPVLATGIACGCDGLSSERAPLGGTEAAPVPAVTTDGNDLGALMQRVHFGYRADGATLRAGHDTYLAAVTRDGKLAFTPQLAAAGATEPARGPGVAVQTLGAWRGGATVATAAHATSLQADGSVTLLRGPVRERFRNGADGVEQTFELAAEPTGDGPMRVRVAVTGPSFVTETEGGFHFRASASALGVRYGQATWIDAGGAQIALEADFRDGAIEIEVPARVLREARYPAMIDPVIGPELAVDVPVVAATADQRISRLAFDGSQFVAVWQDRRGGVDVDIYGARVDASGRVVGTRNFVVAASAGDQANPDVACLPGSSCVVTWESGGNIYAANIPLGTGDPGPAFAVSTAANLQATPKVACDPRVAVADRRCLVTYYDLRGGLTSDIYGRLIKPDGLDGTGELAISTAPGSQFAPELAFAGTQYLVSWQDGGGAPTARAARVSPAGIVIDAAGFAISTGGLSDRPCAVASDGSNALVVYTRGTTSPTQLWAQRVDTGAGSATGAAVRLDTGNSYLCSADFDGTSYLVAWADPSLKAVGRRLTPAGALIDAGPVVLSGSASTSAIYVDVAFGGGAHLATWEDTRTIGSTGYDLYGARIAPDLSRRSRLDTLLSLTGTSSGQFTPDVARNFQSYLVVWADSRGGTNTDIYGARFDFAGNLLDPTGIAISTAATDQRRPAVASDGKAFFVVWEDSRDAASARNIYGARVDETGFVLDPTGFVVSSAAGDQGDPDLAFDQPSQQFLAVWSDKRSGTNTDIYGTRIDRAATVLAPGGVAVSAYPGSDQTEPAIANRDGRFLVTWTDTISAVPTIWGAIVGSSGAVLVPDFPIGPSGSLRPAVTSNGLDFFVAWQRRDYASIDGRAVSFNATMLTGVLAISPVLPGSSNVALGHDGASYAVVYNRAQTLYGRRITTLGAPLDPERLIQVGSGNDVFEPAIAASTVNHYFVAYQRFINTPPIYASRVFARTLEF